MKNTASRPTGARAKVKAIQQVLSGTLNDSLGVVAGLDALDAKFVSLREAIDKAIDGPADARNASAKKIVTDNSVFNDAVTALLDGQVRRIARIDGDAYRQASYANIAWTLRDVGGLNASLHKNLVGSKRVATEPEKLDLSRSQGRNDQILSTLQELRGNPAQLWLLPLPRFGQAVRD